MSSYLPPTIDMIKIYHNPRCSTSRNALQAIEASGQAVQIVEYLKALPPRDELRELIRAAGLTVREAMRTKEAVYRELALDAPDLTDEELLDAIQDHPVLLNRPFVVTDKGTRLCRPLERIHEIL